MNTPRGTALITGAGGGIGLSTAAALTDDGWQVIATVRNLATADALREAAADRTIEIRDMDVTSQASVDGCVAAALAHHGNIDLLVNNAGTGHRGTTEQLGIDEFERCFDVNFYGVVRVTRAVVPGMRVRGSGRIITVTSLNGVIAMPFSDAYNAAKQAVEGLMEGLAPVLRAFGVQVSVLEPGPARTGFLRNARGRITDVAADDPYAELLGRYNTTMANMLNSGEDVADVAGVIAEIARAVHPDFRYQSSPNATALAGRKLVDPTGNSVVAATSAFLMQAG